MEHCKSCGTELNALMISEISKEEIKTIKVMTGDNVEGWCNNCVEIKKEMIHPIKEDLEVYGISDQTLNEMSRMLWPFPGTGVNGYRQNMDQFKPNPIDSRLDYIRESLAEFELNKEAELIFAHDIQQDKLERMSDEQRFIEMNSEE